MTQIARGLRVLVAGVAVGVAGVVCGGGTASADPLFPPGPTPVPA
ncbi:hypothetical protein CQY23_22965, partial [Mycobacterium celatum]